MSLNISSIEYYFHFCVHLQFQVTEEILKMLIEDEEYLAVYFSGPCDDPEDDCALILDELESVDTTMQVDIKHQRNID